MTKQQKALQVQISDLIEMGYEIKSVFYTDLNNAYVFGTRNYKSALIVTTIHYKYDKERDYFDIARCSTM